MARALIAILLAFAAVEGVLAANTTANATTEAPTTTAATTEAPTTEANTTEAPTTMAPTTEAPTTEAPTTEGNGTGAPTTMAPTTEAPTTEAPTTAAPTTEGNGTGAPTTMAPTTEAPTTEAPSGNTTGAPASTESPTTEGTTDDTGGSTTTTTTTTTIGATSITGTLNMYIPGVNQSVVETASTEALAGHFNVSTNLLNVTATESRRLRSDVRRLAGNWAVAFQFYAPPEKAEAVTAKADSASTDEATFKTQFTEVFKTALTNAGAPSSAVNAVQVSSVSVAVVYAPGNALANTTTTMAAGAGNPPSGGALKTGLSMVAMVIAAIKMML